MFLRLVDRDGFVSLQEYMAFMISRETENVQSATEVEQAFRALTSGEKPYITANELYAVCTTSPHFETEWRCFLFPYKMELVSSSEDRLSCLPDYNRFEDTMAVCILQNLTKEQADYCISRMKPYEDPRSGRTIPDAYDYSEFTRELFIN